MTARDARSRVEVAVAWAFGNLSVAWPFVLFGLVLALSWGTLGHIRPSHVRLALQSLDSAWLWLAVGLTALNVAVMGLYDVVAFRQTRCPWPQRWRHGAMAFAWSNFLTLGPLAGPAVRFWLYRNDVDQASDLHAGVAATTIAFVSGLLGWLAAVLAVQQSGASGSVNIVMAAPLAFALALALAATARRQVLRFKSFEAPHGRVAGALQLAIVGWLDWLLAAAVFVACVNAAGSRSVLAQHVFAFFSGQAIGIASLVPGGLGSSDAYWIARMPGPQSVTAAMLLVYRAIYYVIPWAIASMFLLAAATRTTTRRLEFARRAVAGLVGGGGILIVLSSASPALHARLLLVERVVPLPLVEGGQLVAALGGLLLIVLARGLARGYRAAWRATLLLLTLAALGALLKGLDWEEATILGLLGIGAWSQGSLFERRASGRWFEGADLVLACAALALFITVGSVSHRVDARTLARWGELGYRLEATRFVRIAASMACAVATAALYLLLRPPLRFTKLSDAEIERTLALQAASGAGTNPLMVAAGDKAVFFAADGFCLYRTIGPYLIVFSDPVVPPAASRSGFLDALATLASDCDRRLVFYQLSLDWVPQLHDRGYYFFKLGEQADIRLDTVTLDGHAGKMYRQALRRAERDGLVFRIMTPDEVVTRMTELADVSAQWLQARTVVERQFSVGFFDEDYMRRFPCAVVEQASAPHAILAFANLLEGPRHEELSVDLMRHRPDGPQVMDFLVVSLLLEGKRAGYRTFNLGMAPLASVGTQRGAHLRERLARLLFQRGQQFYNFQGLRFYKEKFNPEWVPRYMAYPDAWEWPVAMAHASALIAGGWRRILLPPRAADARSEPAVATPWPPLPDSAAPR